MSNANIATLTPAEMVAKMDDDSLAVAAHSLQEYISRKTDAFESAIADDKAMHGAILAELVARIHKNGPKARTLYSPTVEVKLKVTEKIDHRIDVLRTLKGLVPDEDFHKAVYEKTTVEWKANGAKLNALASKHGGKVAEIVQQGMPRVQVGIPKVTVRPREEMKTVLPDTLAA